MKMLLLSAVVNLLLVVSYLLWSSITVVPTIQERHNSECLVILIALLCNAILLLILLTIKLNRSAVKAGD